MRNFRINDLEKYSGVKAHTLRIWEHRYGMPSPQRTTSNIRNYALEEVIKILKLSLLNRNGYKISQLALLSCEEVELRLKRFTDAENVFQVIIIDLLQQMYLMNAEAFEETLNKNFSLYGGSRTMIEIVYPFLRMTNLLWQGRRLTEEHMVVTILRKKIIYAIENLPKGEKLEKTVLLFLIDTRQLDLGLLYTYYHLKRTGIKVFYLGNDVSFENVKIVFDKINPDFLYTYFPANGSWVPKFLNDIRKTDLSSRFIFTKQPCGGDVAYACSDMQSTRFEDALEMMTASEMSNRVNIPYSVV